jgi:ribonuclease VapC
MSLVVDTSAILAVYLGESTAAWTSQQLNAAQRLTMSTINLAECLMVLRHRRPTDFAAFAQQLLSSNIDFIPVDTAHATLAAEARDQFPLNLGDCFAYALAKSLGLPLLTLDADFRKTDITVVHP